MKVLHICAVGITAQRLLLPQIKALLNQGLIVEIACSPGSEVDDLRQQGYTVHPVQIDRRIEPISNLNSVYHLVRLMRQHRYDVVHVHTPIAAVLGRVAAKLAGVPRIIYTAHGFPFHEQSSPTHYHIYFTIEKACAVLTDLILTQSHEDFINAQKYKLCSPDKVRHLNNGIDIEYFSRDRLNPVHQSQLRKSLKLPDSAILIGIVGRLIYQKGSGYLIEAIHQLLPQFPDLHVLVIGGSLSTDRDPFEKELAKRIETLGIADHITFTGFRDDIPELLGLLDIFTLPTFFGEGLPRSILEAMAMELPVVTTNIRGCREAVIPGKTGLIVPPKSSEKLAAALNFLLSYPSMSRAYGRAGRRYVESEFDERLVFQRLADAYQDLGIVFA